MRRVAFTALLSHWRRQPVQLITLVIGLALATGLWSAVQAINGQARASYAQAAKQLATNQLTSLTLSSGAIPLATYVTLRRAGWQVSPLLEGRARLGNATVTVLGIDFLSYPRELSPGTAQPGLLPSDVLTAPGRLFAHPETVEKIGNGALIAPLVSSEQVPFGIITTDIGTAEQILDMQEQISRILVLPQQPIGLPPLGSIAPELSLTVPQNDKDIERLTDSFHLNLTAFGLLSFAVGLFIVHGAVGLAFHQRRGMFRTLRALGLPLMTLIRLLLAELLFLAFLSGALGLVLGYFVAAALLPDVTATLRGLYGAPVSGGLSLRPSWFVSGLGMAVAGSLVAGAQGLWQLHRLPILAAPGVQSWRLVTDRSIRIQAFIGCVLIAMGILCVFMLSGLIAGFALLAGIMLGSALLLPPALSFILDRTARFATGAVAEWIWADLRSQLPGLSLALMALLLALATNIGVGTMVSSFRLTFAGWLDQRLASELYVTAGSEEQAREIEKWLAPRSDAVLPIRYIEGTIAGGDARIYGVIDDPTYRNSWPLIAALPDVWDRIHTGQAALINEQLARRTGLWPGDIIVLAPDWVAEIAGVYSDYGNPTGQAITSLSQVLLHFDDVPNRQFGIRTSKENVAILAEELQNTFDLPGTGVIDQASIKARSLGVFEKTFIVTGALNVLTLGVASFAILTSLLTLWTLRLPQLAPVWAQGLTRKTLSRLELWRSVILAALTALLALPLGLVLAWVLLAVVNVEAFGWRLPMYFFPLDWLLLGALAILAGAVAAILPARRLKTTPPTELLKIFSNER